MLAEQGENINTVLGTAEDAGNELIAVSRSLQNVATKLDSLVDTLQVTANDTDRLINDEGAELITSGKPPLNHGGNSRTPPRISWLSMKIHCTIFPRKGFMNSLCFCRKHGI